MRQTKLAVVGVLMAVLLAASYGGLVLIARGQAGQPSGRAGQPGGQAAQPRPFGGPLAPDSPIAKGYNDAAKALAAVDDNPMIQWNYRIWCVTGYRTNGEAGTGQQIDALLDPEHDMMSPKGFIDPGHAKPMPPGGVQFMDSAWYFGNDSIGAVVVKVPEGLLLFDALSNPQEMETMVIAEMKRDGLNPADFKYVFMGHQHGDHIGGANLIRQKYAPGVKFVMGQPDARGVADARARVLAGDMGPARGPAPARPPTPEQLAAQREARLMALPDRIDIEVPASPGMTTGAQRIRIGDQTEVVATLTPGHTVGQMAVIVPVTYKGSPHKLAIWSGNDAANTAQYAASFDFLRSIATLEKADAYINTHGYQGDAFKLLKQMKANPDMANPFILGIDGVQRQLGILADCQRAIGRRMLDGTWKHL